MWSSQHATFEVYLLFMIAEMGKKFKDWKIEVLFAGQTINKLQFMSLKMLFFRKGNEAKINIADQAKMPDPDSDTE